RPIEQEAEVGSDERVGCGDRVGVVHGSVLPRERDVAGILAQAVLELGADLAGQNRSQPGGFCVISWSSGICLACCSVRASPKSNGKSVAYVETYGNCQPIRCL